MLMISRTLKILCHGFTHSGTMSLIFTDEKSVRIREIRGLDF
jgi:hypothetical protein